MTTHNTASDKAAETIGEAQQAVAAKATEVLDKAAGALGEAQQTVAAKANELVSAVQQKLPEGYSNVGQDERTLCLVGGGALALYGLGTRSPSGMAVALLGGYLVYRGYTGRCAVYEALGIDTARPDRPRKPLPRKQDVVMEASEDSFPASDPPSWGESGVKG